MNSVASAVFDFLQERGNEYENPQEVIFILNPDASVHVKYKWPEGTVEGSMNLGLIYTGTTIDDLVNTFGILAIQRIQTITPDLLLKLYYKGKAELYSRLYVDMMHHLLYYRRQNNKLLYRVDDGPYQEVDGLINAHKQFAKYTRQHSRLGRRNKGNNDKPPSSD